MRAQLPPFSAASCHFVPLTPPFVVLQDHVLHAGSCELQEVANHQIEVAKSHREISVAQAGELSRQLRLVQALGRAKAAQNLEADLLADVI